MAFMVGSFAGGLFQGAQSAMSLYSMYQGISAQQAASDNIANAEAENKVNKDVPGWNDVTQKPATVPQGTDQTPEYVSGQRVQRDAQGNLVPVAPSDIKTDTGPTKPAQIAGVAGAAAPGAAPVKPALTQAPTPSGLAPYNQATSTDAYRAPADTGVPQPPAQQPTVQQPPAIAPSSPATNYAGVAGAPGSQSGPEQLPPQPLTPAQRRGAQLPVVPPQRIVSVDQSQVNTPLNRGALPQPSVPPAAQVSPTQMPTYDVPSEGITPAPPQAPSVTQQEGGYLGSRLGGQSPAIPSQQPRPGGPTILPEQFPYSPTTVPDQAPGGGGAVQGGTPLAQNAQPSIGARLASMFNPVGSAQAAEASPGAPPAQAPNQIWNQANPPGTAQLSGGTAAPAAALPQAAPPAATTSAEPPKADTPPATQPGPVKVAGKDGAVAPGQQGPSVQTETTPPVLAPPVSPAAFNQISRSNPQLAATIAQVVADHGGGAVDVYEVAATVMRESGGDPSKRGAAGEFGLMQIMPATWKMVDQQGRFDPNNSKDNLVVGVTYMKSLAMQYGAGTVQAHLAYMRGDGGVADVKRLGWDGYAKANPIAANGVTGMYDGKMSIDNSMFPGGGSHVDPEALVRAGHTSGPDGALAYIASVGPAGAGMSDHWRAAQAALERYAIWSGHPENVPHAAEWIAQISHQGALSNMMAADQALLGGNSQGAAQLLAKAHAFFPDNSYGRFGVDKSGKLWGQTFSEQTGQPLGNAMPITHEMLAQQMIMLQNPTNYIQALQKYQLTNAQIDQTKAHAQYYEDVPAERLEAAKLRAQQQQEAIEQRRDAADQRDATARAGIQQHKDAAELRAETAAGNTAAGERPIDSYINKEYGQDGSMAGAPPAQAEAHRALMYPARSGGAAMSGPMAGEYAKGLTDGSGKYQLQEWNTKDGKGKGYTIGDSKNKTVSAPLSQELGERLSQLPGIKKMSGGEVLPPRAQQGALNTGPVGAGAGSQTAMSSGYNQNLSNMPMQALPQQQPQQTMAA